VEYDLITFLTLDSVHFFINRKNKLETEEILMIWIFSWIYINFIRMERILLNRELHFDPYIKLRNLDFFPKGSEVLLIKFMQE
jgi:hypothetical protein